MIVLTADKVRVLGPDKDGGYKLTFELGEYMQKEVTEVLLLPQNTNLVLTVAEMSEVEKHE